MNDLRNIPKLASSNKRRKLTKHACFNVLLDMIRDKNTVAPDGHLADLYNYFIPSLPKKPKTPVGWVALAAANNRHHRVALSYICSNGKYIAATDGERLHMHLTDKYSDGLYDHMMSPIGPSLSYPDVDRLLFTKNEVECSTDGLEIITLNNVGFAYKIGEWGYRKEHLDCALSVMTDHTAIIDYNRLIIRDKHHVAIIMGTRI